MRQLGSCHFRRPSDSSSRSVSQQLHEYYLTVFKDLEAIFSTCSEDTEKRIASQPDVQHVLSDLLGQDVSSREQPPGEWHQDPCSTRAVQG